MRCPKCGADKLVFEDWTFYNQSADQLEIGERYQCASCGEYFKRRASFKLASERWEHLDETNLCGSR